MRTLIRGGSPIRRYIIRRLFLLIPLLLGVTILTFSLTKALPGDPALSLVGERASPEVIASIRKELHTDQNFSVQYIGYVTLLLR
ncbi:MAG TPA: hypothetical protein VEI28_07025, partial [Thermodesulfovibrionales bacterium]|nr:hypothetical protein [Thermodesulfovibrionales bacterium]